MAQSNTTEIRLESYSWRAAGSTAALCSRDGHKSLPAFVQYNLMCNEGWPAHAIEAYAASHRALSRILSGSWGWVLYLGSPKCQALKVYNYIHVFISVCVFSHS